MLVSILIPCYNAERWVGEAIESALSQTWPEKEIIVVDDGSHDGSLGIIKQFADRIRWEAGPNQGGNAARNRLLHLAHGEWVQYVDADDYLLPEKIERQVRFIQRNPECDVVYSPVLWVRWSEKRSEQEITLIPNPCDPWVLLARWWLPQTGGPLWRKDAILRAGGWKLGQPCCQEHELYLRLLMSGARFVYFGECHAAYRDWSKNNTVSKRNTNEVYRRRLEVEDAMERFLMSTGGLTIERKQAINQARFEIARLVWLRDPATASRIVHSIHRSQPSFIPEAPAAKALYRLFFRTIGFNAAERLASAKRHLSTGTE